MAVGGLTQRRGGGAGGGHKGGSQIQPYTTLTPPRCAGIQTLSMLKQDTS
jgi:hypothetical protein